MTNERTSVILLRSTPVFVMVYRERHEDVVFSLPQFCQPQRAQRTHKEHKDTQAQGFVYFVHTLCSSW